MKSDQCSCCDTTLLHSSFVQGMAQNAVCGHYFSACLLCSAASYMNCHMEHSPWFLGSWDKYSNLISCMGDESATTVFPIKITWIAFLNMVRESVQNRMKHHLQKIYMRLVTFRLRHIQSELLIVGVFSDVLERVFFHQSFGYSGKDDNIVFIIDITTKLPGSYLVEHKPTIWACKLL